MWGRQAIRRYFNDKLKRNIYLLQTFFFTSYLVYAAAFFLCFYYYCRYYCYFAADNRMEEDMVTLSVTYGGETIDISDCSVEQVLQMAPEVTQAIKEQLQVLIEEKQDRTKKHKSDSTYDRSNGISTSRSQDTKSACLEQLAQVRKKIEAWTIDETQTKRKKAKRIYLSLLNSLYSAAEERFTVNVEDIISRVVEYWELFESAEDQAANFINELRMLSKDMTCVPSLKPAVVKSRSA